MATLWGTTRSAPATPTGSASVLIPTFKYYSETITISSTNNIIPFGEGGGALLATVESGTWHFGELRYKVKKALEAAGAGTYEVDYDLGSRKFAIEQTAGGTFTLDVGGDAADLLPSLGFTSDKSGALAYTADVAVPAETSFTATTRIRMPQVEPEVFREDTIHESGRSESVYQGEVVRYPFRLEFESDTTARAFWDMWDSCAKYGNAIDLYPDSTSGQFVTVLWDTKQPKIREMTDRGLYRIYEIELPLRFKVPKGSSTLKPRDFLDRRPSA